MTRAILKSSRPKLKVLDLFSGIGGFSLGLERTGGFETVAFCEIDPFCQKVLKKHWPDVPIYNDVRTLDYDGPVDVITGGYPCQPFSTAGKRRGAEDDRHLWPSMFSLIEKHRPDWVIGENVAGHVSMGLDEVLSDLESADYQARAFIIPAVGVDASHKRDRVWVIAYRQSHGRGQGEQNFGGGHEGILQREEFGFGNNSQTLADTASGGQQGQGELIERGRQEAYGEGQTDHAFAIRQPRFWPTESGFCRVAHGIPRRVDRLRSLGNAVVPQIPEMIGYAILEAHNA